MSDVSQYLDPALVEHLNQMQLSARSVVEGSTIGQHRSPIKGASVEFRQHRFYVAGDEPRRLDWRVLGRTDRPYVKEYDEETNLRCMLLLDCSASMDYAGESAPKSDYAGRLAAALAYLMLGQTESVGVALCGRGIEYWLAPHSGSTQLARVVDALQQCGPLGPTGFPQAINEAAERLERRALVIAISDFFAPIDQIRGVSAHLRHERHEVICLQVLDRDELTFPFKRWTRFRGIEGERAKVCEPALARTAYLKTFQRHAELLRQTAIMLRLELQTLVTDHPLVDALREVLTRRTVRRRS